MLNFIFLYFFLSLRALGRFSHSFTSRLSAGGCLRLTLSLLSANLGTPILVPLTPSLYVPGKLASTETVLVDIGTGFYVEKTPPAAQTFYKGKVEELGKNLGDLEQIVQGKQGNLGVVEDGECMLMRFVVGVRLLIRYSLAAEGDR